jgi:hypothetical protein
MHLQDAESSGRVFRADSSCRATPLLNQRASDEPKDHCCDKPHGKYTHDVMHDRSPALMKANIKAN